MKPTQHPQTQISGTKQKNFEKSNKNPGWKWKLRAHQLEQEEEAWMEAWLAQLAEPLVELGVSWQQEGPAYAPEPRGAGSGHRYRHRPRDQMGSRLPFLSRSKIRKKQTQKP